MNIISITNQAQWHEIRAQHVGGSEVAALFDMSPYQTRYTLWQIKAGHVPPEDLSGSERVMAGNYMEPAIAAWAAEKWDMPLQKFQGYVTHATVKGMGCTPDYWDGQNLLVQIKNVDGLEFYKNPEWEAEGETLTKCPLHIALQCQHELACTGAAGAWLVACIGGNRLARMEIVPRPKTIAKLESAVTEFWQSIADGAEPKPDWLADAETIAALHGEAEAGKEIDLSTNNRAHECAANWLCGRRMASEGDAMQEEAKAELLTMLGDASTAVIGEHRVSASMVKGSNGKTITAGMIGMIIGARKSYRKFSIKQVEQQGEAQ